MASEGPLDSPERVVGVVAVAVGLFVLAVSVMEIVVAAVDGDRRCLRWTWWMLPTLSWKETQVDKRRHENPSRGV